MGVQMQSRQAPAYTQSFPDLIVIKPRFVYYQTQDQGSQYGQQDEQIKLVTRALEQLIWCVRKQRPEALKDLVHQQEGVYVDLKAHWTYERLTREIASQKGYLYEFVFAQKNSQSLYYILGLSKEIEVDYYYTDDGSYELKLDLNAGARCEL